MLLLYIMLDMYGTCFEGPPESEDELPLRTIRNGTQWQLMWVRVENGQVVMPVELMRAVRRRHC